MPVYRISDAHYQVFRASERHHFLHNCATTHLPDGDWLISLGHDAARMLQSERRPSPMGWTKGFGLTLTFHHTVSHEPEPPK